MRKRMNSRNLSQFYNHLATLLNSGLTLEKGLALIKERKKGPLFWMLDGIEDHIRKGGSFWEGMSQHPRYFDDFQIKIVRSAEESGMIVETARKLADYYESRYRAIKRLFMGLIYPVLLLHAVVLLPPLKYLVLENQEKSYASVVMPPLAIGYIIVVLVFFSWLKLFKAGPLRRMADEVILCIPFIGALVRDMSLARVFWSLSAMLTAGLEAVSAAHNAAAAAGNSVISRQLEGALYVLEGGRGFREYFAVSNMLNSDQLTTVGIGEDSGTLAESLSQMVRLMEDSTTHHFHMLMKIGALMVYFIAAAVIALTVISFYKGYFSF
jgi:type II secretory pathway component PulF